MADQQGTPHQSFPLTQRELVGLAMHRGARRPVAPADGPGAIQRERVRAALARGLGDAGKAGRTGRRAGTYR